MPDWILRALPTPETVTKWRARIDRGGHCGGCGAQWVNERGAVMHHAENCILLIVEDHHVDG